ncbi:MAG TPA: SCO family protein [Trebonia sp.]|jgi:cytochrome oxidase Cu insertion factor (SCO1/SenC/PrrC family)|nr:SCO family protein [Trebonia sp.]
MNSGVNPADPIFVSAFRSALLAQFGIVCLIFLILLAAWTLLRGRAGPTSPDAQAWREPRARRVLRIGFGVLWLFDGILQAQPQMPGGLPSQVIQPAAGTSPAWVQHLVNWGGTIWTYHPIQAASATVWIQVGIGLWLIFGARGWSSRLAGLASAGWGLIVWVFGEAFGGIFAPGLTVLFGAPGGVLFYVIAGLLIFLPSRSLLSPMAGRLVLALTGSFLAGMAVLQAWPGNGFWSGAVSGKPGPLTSMIQSMAATPQPRPLASLVSAFGSFTAAHGWGVNLFAVIALALLGAGFCVSAAVPDGARLAKITALAGLVLCLADWVLIEDFGFFGGLGTDPNSMIPLILVFTAGCAALTPAAAPEPLTEPAVPAMPASASRSWIAALSGRTVAAAGALCVVLVGVAPMAAASVSPDADPIVAQAIAGQSAPINVPAPGFTLTSQDGHPVSLASLRGKAVLLAFLDPVCTSDCPIIAAEMRAADAVLGARARNVTLVAIVANPTYRSIALTRAFDQQEGLGQVPNWLYLTGSLSQLRKVWNAYGVQVEDLPAGAMVAHADLAFVISPSGRIREELSDDPGPGTASSQSSFAVLMADAVTQSMGATQ